MEEHFLGLPLQATPRSFDYEDIQLKDNHTDFPLFITHDCKLILETFNEKSDLCTSFLIAISEPVSRPAQIHEYRITAYSLYAAASVGLSTTEILHDLISFSKNHLPKSVERFIRDCTLSYGKVKLVLEKGEYYIETESEGIKKRLLKDSIISQCIYEEGDKIRALKEKIEIIKKRSIELDYPLLEEYDFKNDTLEAVPIFLKSSVEIRPYQELSLSKMYGNGRARSGIIVLPCGAGKTLVGIAAIASMGRPTLVLCTSAVSVEQWYTQLLKFTKSEKAICRFTSDRKEIDEDMGILITTYSMMAYSGKRSHDAQKAVKLIAERTWGLLILDEVHVVPAQMFRRVLSIATHHCKLGLTATLLREDSKIEDLNFLIGPKLYEADWQSLAKAGHIATVQCAEVWCAMDGAFYREYLKSKRKSILAIMNPHKFRMCEYLISKHEKRGDKIIVFSDSVAALKTYALKLGRPFIYGPTSQAERMRILSQFECNPAISTIFLSKVGDTSIDLPEATVLIQISSHFGSRRQEAQRLGRILRARRRNDPGFKVFFYSLVSMDTEEMGYSKKRRQFLIDQGYIFQILKPGHFFDSKSLCGFDPEHTPSYKAFLKVSVLGSKAQEKELLTNILMAASLNEEEEFEDELVENEVDIKPVKKKAVEVVGQQGKYKERHKLFKNRR